MKRIWVAGVGLDSTREELVSSSGGLLVQRTVRVSGVERELSRALGPWRSDRATHDPGKVLLDLGTAVALGGDCAADVAVVRAQPQLFGAVASDPTVSRLISTLAADVEAAVEGIRAARAAAGERVWASRRPLAGRVGSQVTIEPHWV